MKVIAIVYDGSEIPQSTIVETLKPMFDKYASNPNIVVKQYGEEDLIKMGIAASVGKIAKTSKEEEIVHAVVYIKEKFGEIFDNKVQLALGFIESLNMHDTLLSNAINIIYNNRTNVAAITAEGLPLGVLNAIISFKENYHV